MPNSRSAYAEPVGVDAAAACLDARRPAHATIEMSPKREEARRPSQDRRSRRPLDCLVRAPVRPERRGRPVGAARHGCFAREGDASPAGISGVLLVIPKRSRIRRRFPPTRR